MDENKKEVAQEVQVQEQLANNVCPNCGFHKCPYYRLSHGKSSINQIRAEYGLEPIKDESLDKFFIAKE